MTIIIEHYHKTAHYAKRAPQPNNYNQSQTMGPVAYTEHFSFFKYNEIVYEINTFCCHLSVPIHYDINFQIWRSGDRAS